MEEEKEGVGRKEGEEGKRKGRDTEGRMEGEGGARERERETTVRMNNHSAHTHACRED